MSDAWSSFIPRSIRHRYQLILACCLIASGAYGLIYASKASIAQRLYLKTKYGFKPSLVHATSPITDTDVASASAQLASRLYPHNYYFPAYVAKCALTQAASATDSVSYRNYLNQALYFSKQAVALNPYNDEARITYALALADSDNLQEAIEFWKSQVISREYWILFNQEFYARLCLRSTDPKDLQEAVWTAPLIRDPTLKKKLARLKFKLTPR